MVSSDAKIGRQVDAIRAGALWALLNKKLRAENAQTPEQSRKEEKSLEGYGLWVAKLTT